MERQSTQAMSFLLDEMMPSAVHRLIDDRGHVSHWSRDILRTSAPDDQVADVANRLRAVLLTYNKKDFNKLAARHPPVGNQHRLRHLSIIYFTCREPDAAARMEQFFDLIELELESAERRADRRTFIEVGGTFLKVVR